MDKVENIAQNMEDMKVGDDENKAAQNHPKDVTREYVLSL